MFRRSVKALIKLLVTCFKEMIPCRDFSLQGSIFSLMPNYFYLVSFNFISGSIKFYLFQERTRKS